MFDMIAFNKFLFKSIILLTYYEKSITNNIMYTTQELHSFHNHLELNYNSFHLDVTPFYQCFHHILQLIYELTSLYI